MGGDEFQGYDKDGEAQDGPRAMNHTNEFGGGDGSLYGGQAIKKHNYDENAVLYVTNMGISEAESRFTQNEIAQIKREYEKNSKEDIIGKRKLIEYFRITDIQDTYLSNELFNVIKNSDQLNKPIDY